MTFNLLIRAISISLYFALAAGCSTSSSKPQLLPPQEAFKVSESRSGEDVILRFTVAEEYYLYEGRFRLEVVRPVGAKTRMAYEADVPQSAIELQGRVVTINDPFFGNTRVYKNELAVRIRKSTLPAGTPAVFVIYQGAWNREIAYPPKRYFVDLNAPYPRE